MTKSAYLATSASAGLFKPFAEEMSKRGDFHIVTARPELEQHFLDHGLSTKVIDPRPHYREFASYSEDRRLEELAALRKRLGLPTFRTLFWSERSYATKSVYSTYDVADAQIRALSLSRAIEDYLKTEKPDVICQQYGAELDRRLVRMLGDEHGVDAIFFEYIPYYRGFQASRDEIGNCYDIKLRDVAEEEIDRYIRKYMEGDIDYFLRMPTDSSPGLKFTRFMNDPRRFTIASDYIRFQGKKRYGRLRKQVVDRAGNLLFTKPPKGKKTILYPLQTPVESTITVRSRGFFDQNALIRQIALNMPDEYILLVKLHPHYFGGDSLSEMYDLMRIPGVYFLPSDHRMREVLEDVDIVVTVNSTTGFEGALLGKPVVSIGHSVYDGAGISLPLEKPGELAEVLSRAESFTPPMENIRGLIRVWLERALNGWFNNHADELADDMQLFFKAREKRK